MRQTLPLGLIAFVLACASGGLDSELLTDWEPPEGQECVAVDEPERLPSVGAVVDSAALAGALEQSRGRASGHVLYSLAADTTGEWRRVEPIEGNLDRAEQPALTRLLRTHLKTPPPARYLRFRIDHSESIQFAVGRRQECRPSLRNGDEVARLIQATSAEIDARGTALVRVWVETDGTAGDVEIVRSSGDGALDAAVRQIGASMRFHPALIDQIPEAVWAQMPISIR